MIEGEAVDTETRVDHVDTEDYAAPEEADEALKIEKFTEDNPLAGRVKNFLS